MFLLIFQLVVFPKVLINHDNSSYNLYLNQINDQGTANKSVASASQETDYDHDANTCIEPGYENICSGHGICHDGICQCDSFRSRENGTEALYEYSGTFCEECPYCKGQRCQKLLPCVESVLLNSSGNTHCHIYYNLVNKINSLNYNDKFCQIEDIDRCMIQFKYFYDSNNTLFIDIEQNRRCMNGRKYLLTAWCLFLIYIFILMLVLKFL